MGQEREKWERIAEGIRRRVRGGSQEPWAREKAIELAVKRYMATHPGATRADALLAVLRAKTLLQTGAIDAAIERAKQGAKPRGK